MPALFHPRTTRGGRRRHLCSSAWSAISQNADTIHDQITNTNAITFPVVTASPYMVVGVRDALTNGNVWFYQAVTSQSVSVHNQYQIGSGTLALEC